MNKTADLHVRPAANEPASVPISEAPKDDQKAPSLRIRSGLKAGFGRRDMRSW
jgi:hypothetical protein